MNKLNNYNNKIIVTLKVKSRKLKLYNFILFEIQKFMFRIIN